jgi:hypothetical protein
VLLILLLISGDLRLFQVLTNAEDNFKSSTRLKTRDISTLTNPHLPLNNGYNPLSSIIF